MNDVLAPEANPHAPRSTRRTLLRTAAWSVPAVTMASAAPAFAGSGSTPALSLDPAPVAQWTTTGTLIFTVTVKNNHPSTPAADLKVTVSFPSAFVKPGNGEVTISFPTSTTGWSSGVVYGGNGNTRTALATFATATPLTGDATRTFQFIATPSGTVGATAALSVGAQSSTHTQISRAISPTPVP